MRENIRKGGRIQEKKGENEGENEGENGAALVIRHTRAIIGVRLEAHE